MKKCKWCGSGAGGNLFPITGYDWEAEERGDEDALSFKIILGYQCLNATECAQRVVQQGTNIEALQRIAHDQENLGELATQARGILQSWAEMAHAEAKSADLVAREQGWSAIGHIPL